MYNAEGSFARKQLEKHGWTEGSGLGSSQQGISQAIRVKIKHDTTGVGHDPVKEFSHHWWDHVFNKAAASLVVENGKDGAVVKKKEITQKERTETAKKVLYGNFIKSSLLSNGTETKMEREGESSDSSDDEGQQKVQTLFLPDEELLQKCGGRTAHKGARHGLKLNGKLARIQEQERLLVGKNHNSPSAAPLPSHNGVADTASCATEDSNRTKKSKKRKRADREDEEGESEGKVQVLAGEETDSTRLSENSGATSGKKKKRKKQERAEAEVQERRGKETGKDSSEKDGTLQNDSPCLTAEEYASVAKKRRKKSKTKSADEKLVDSGWNDSFTPQNKNKNSLCPLVQEDASHVKKRRKKSKTKVADVSGDSCSDSQAKSKHGEVCSDAPAVVNGSPVSVEGEHKKSCKKSKKRKKSKGRDE